MSLQCISASLRAGVLWKYNNEKREFIGTGRCEYCDEQGNCRDLQQLSNVVDFSRDEAEIRKAWEGWRTVSPPMRELYARQVELANEGARELGFGNVGEMWRSQYDMPAADFPAELDRAWGQVKPLYESLHCYVRNRLGEHYGTDIVPQDQPIPAHLLGNMWAQEWGNIYDLVRAPAELDSNIDVTRLLEEHG